MSLRGINVEVDIRTILGAFDRIRRVDTKKVLSDLRGPARFDQRHHWRKEESPRGHWRGLAASTLERRKRKRGMDRKSGKNRSWPKKLLGRFPNALQAQVSARELRIISRVKRFSMVHQEGGSVGHGAYVPARQYLWISSWLISQIRTYFEKRLEFEAKRV